jgi:CheY-like chemotaxis protein
VANELILVVEDDEKSRKLLRDVLTVKGYTIVEAETGEEGVRLAQERRPGLAERCRGSRRKSQIIALRGVHRMGVPSARGRGYNELKRELKG